ncbi:putative metal ion transporter c27b12.12c [Acrodontium crateriforme]|uniref:Metal ion transporter c27b12.12c n=1 Tax=Acrodontium crateriforme TaxID=150365 RepID=A0AAQ3R4C7_9PEZI|nr:putative metal ion transporter c27b12.12c [Acrodontium crateriforme]
MSASPHDRIRTRFSTPEPDLDDHRHQPESLPPAIETYANARRGTLASLAERPRFEITAPSGSVARDFENAIDDDQSIKSHISTRSKRSQRSADEDWHRERRKERRGSGSSGPVPARRDTFRRAIHNMQREAGHASRDTSRSRSTSPPNSVDAFAPPRRGRTGTINSRPGSTIENVGLNRTASNATNPRGRHGTFGEEGTVGIRTDVASLRSSVAEDVCFPPEEPPNTYTIDFEDLEEFVAQAHPKTPVAHPFMPSFKTANEEVNKRVFEDKRISALCGSINGAVPNGEYFHEPPTDTNLSGRTVINEKGEEQDGPTTALRRAPSNFEFTNRFTFFSSEIDETIHAPELGGLLMPGETFRDLFELGPEGGVWWLDMLNPSEEEIFSICGAFRVHPLTREDITTQETREKVELFKNYYFLCFRSFYALDKTSEDYLEPINIYAVVFREGLLTFSFCPNPHAAHVRKRIARLRDYVNLSADWVCYALIDEIVDEFAPVLREVERETDTIEDSIFTARFEDSRAILLSIGECRKKIMSLSRLLGGKADVIKGFAKKCNEAHAVAPRGDVGLYLSDVQDHIVTMMSNLGHFEKMLSRTHSNHLSQISLNHIEQGSQGNALLGRITVFATILVPLNLIAGLFGMNVHVPGEGVDGYAWWFGIVGVILTFTIICVTLAKRMKYV